MGVNVKSIDRPLMMRATAYVFVVDAFQFEQKLSAAFVELHQLTERLLEEKGIEKGIRCETLEILSDFLLSKTYDAPLETMHALCWMLEANFEKLETEIQYWKIQYYDQLELETMPHAARPYWLPSPSQRLPSSIFVPRDRIGQAISWLTKSDSGGEFFEDFQRARHDLIETFSSIE